MENPGILPPSQAARPPTARHGRSAGAILDVKEIKP
jgi:hypothetical protein